MSPTVHAFAHHTGGVVVTAVVCSALGLAVARRARLDDGIGSTFWTWATALVIFLALGSAYVIAHDPIAGNLGSSVYRTTIAPRILLLTEAAIWALVGLEMVVRAPERAPVTR